MIIFNGGYGNPIIHRVIQADGGITTKGDNNGGLLPQEQNIPEDAILGKAVFRVPAVGWIKLIFFEFSRDKGSRGFCF